MTNAKQYTSGVTLTDIEDAILQGQEQFIEIMAKVQAEYLAPLMEQMAAMQIAAMSPEQMAQMQAQMEASRGANQG